MGKFGFPPAGQPRCSNRVSQYGHNWEDARKSDESEPVNQWAPAGNACGEAQPDSRDHGDRHRRSGDAAAVIGEGHNGPAGPECEQNHNNVGTDDVPGQRSAGDDAEATQHDAHGNADCHGNPEPPGVDGSARCVLGLYRHRNEGRLGHGRREADGTGKGVEQQVVVPVDAVSQPLRSNRLGSGELARHGLANREERTLQAYEE